MLSRTTLPALAMTALLAAAPAHAANGTAEEAKALLEKAIAHFETAGPEQAYKDFSDASGPFVDRDLYVFCLDMEGNNRAHGVNPALIGKNLIKLKDSDGVELIAEMIKVAQGPGEGWVDYKWPNPTTKKIEPKSSYVRKVGDGLCAVGIYK